MLPESTFVNCNISAFFFQAHLRRHVQIHKRTENYNPRQRKLRNVIVQDMDGGSVDNKANKTADDTLVTEETGYNTDDAVTQDSTIPKTDSLTGLTSSCMMRVMMESSDGTMEEVMSNENLAQVEAVESFSVPEVLQQTQLVTETYESTIDVGGIVGNMSKSKT